MNLEAGVDEVGRGPLAGPVYAAAVILNPEIKIKGLNDSKKLSKEKRNSLSDEIKENSICWNIASVERETIDEINILQASLLAMKNAVQGLETKPDLVLVDGDNDLGIEITSKAVINGDQEIECIMAASIIAKVARDKFMTDIDDKYPEYGFKNHKGYGTKEHLTALKLHGPCNEHRDSFKPVIEAKKYNYSKFSYDLKIRSIVRDKLMTMNDMEIRTWLKSEESKSKDYAKELKKALNEEWIFIRDCSKLRNF
ncbi:MAG: ribonuclease HII [Gammaproteobacteria bacterium]|nr:ribonuclease HII [Gammaproteobacteria bacterium]|tara:strand:+ start:5029 stop:5790 length:762 start_codon:yes stop_codon:yes gene_type:complete